MFYQVQLCSDGIPHKEYTFKFKVRLKAEPLKEGH